MSFENSDLYLAIKNKQSSTPEKTLAIIKSGYDIHEKSSTGQTYLHHVVQSYQGDEDATSLLPVVFQLSNSGILVNDTDNEGNTALHVAAATSGARKLLRVLLMIGADPLQENTKGMSYKCVYCEHQTQKEAECNVEISTN